MVKKEETPGIKFSKQLWENSKAEPKKTAPIQFKEVLWQHDKKAEVEKPIQFGKSMWDDKNQKQEKRDEPVKFQPQQWREIQGIQNPTVIRQFDGINQMNAFAIKDTYATRNKNVTTASYPALTTRPGSKKIRPGLGNMTDSVVGLLVYMGKDLHAIIGKSWYKYNNNVWEQVLFNVFTNEASVSYTHFKGNFANMCLLAANGKDKVKKFDGTTVSDLANAPDGANYVCTHDNRVYLAKGQTVHFSALRKAEDWTTVDDAGQIVLESSDGQDISGMVAGSARLTVFKPNAMYELFGTRPANFQLKLVTENLGCPAGQTVQVIDGAIFFLGNDGIYRYSGGSLPDKEFSIPVKEYMERINREQIGVSMSWTDERRYYVAIPIDNSAVPNVVLEYDLLYKTWNTWELPYALNTNPVHINQEVFYGTKEGHVFQFDSTLTKDDNQLIQWEWVSKPFTFASMAAKMRWYRLWLTASVPLGSSMNVYLSDKESGEDWTLVKAVPAEENWQSAEIFIPVNTVFHSNTVRIRLEGVGPVTIYEITRQERVFPLV